MMTVRLSGSPVWIHGVSARCHRLTPERRVLGRDVLRSGPGLGTRHRGTGVPPEAAYSCPHSSRKKVPRSGCDPGTLWSCSRGFPRCATESCPEAAVPSWESRHRAPLYLVDLLSVECPMLSSSNLQQSMVGLSMLDAGMFPSGAESYPYMPPRLLLA